MCDSACSEKGDKSPFTLVKTTSKNSGKFSPGDATKQSLKAKAPAQVTTIPTEVALESVIETLVTENDNTTDNIYYKMNKINNTNE